MARKTPPRNPLDGALASKSHNAVTPILRRDCRLVFPQGRQIATIRAHRGNMRRSTRAGQHRSSVMIKMFAVAAALAGCVALAAPASAAPLAPASAAVAAAKGDANLV